MAKNPYEILGVTKDASEADIKSAYRKLAKQHHPDLNPDSKTAANKFQEISAANDILSDKDKRAAFDRGEIDIDGQPRQQQFYRDHAQGAGGRRYYNTGTSPEDASGFEDIFSSFFGGGKGMGGESPFAADAPGHVRYTIAIDFLEAALGGSKRVTMPDGKTLDITIPAGIQEGQQLRLKGQGNKGTRGSGDAYIEVHIQPHTQFTRKGNDIHTETAIGFHESILASKIQVPTIHGAVEVTIPKGASSGATLRLKGKGIKNADQYVTLKIVMPKPIDAELEQFTRSWAEKHGYNPRSQKENT